MESATLPDPTGLPPWAYLAVVLIMVAGQMTIAWATLHQGKQIKHQVKNDHKSNLREDIDQAIERLDRIAKTGTETNTEMRQIKGCIRNIDGSLTKLHQRTGRIGDEVRADREDFDVLRREFWAAQRRAEAFAAKHFPDTGQ